MDHKIILKCRVCLDEFDEELMYELFKITENEHSAQTTATAAANTSQHDSSLKICEKVEFCCGVRIRESPDMPTKICAKCYDMTRMWFNFRQMCANSQVYLESMCEDRSKPSELKGTDDCDYFEYLFEDLQTFRAEARHINSAFAINRDFFSTTLKSEVVDGDMEGEGEDAGDETEEFEVTEVDNDEYEQDDTYFEALSLEAADSDPDLDQIIQNIKREQHDEEEMEHEFVEEQIVEEETVLAAPAPTTTTKTRTNKKKVLKQNNLQKKAGGSHVARRYRPPSPTSYMCSICGNVYAKKASFQYHMSLHSDVKPHECELCGKAFRQVCELKNHMRRHTGERPYKCTYCDRHFIDRSEKHRHERVHTNTRPYICKICGKSFMYSAILKNHSKLHSGEKDYNCLVCQKSFTLQHQLKAHLLTITHKQKEEHFVSAGYEVVYE